MTLLFNMNTKPGAMRDMGLKLVLMQIEIALIHNIETWVCEGCSTEKSFYSCLVT